MQAKARTFNSLMLVMAFLVITQRVLTPFVVPPLLVHADGTLEICSWQGSSERLVFNSEGERVESQRPLSQCPACALSPAITATAFPAHQTAGLVEPSLIPPSPGFYPPAETRQPPARAPPLTA
ncbi:hypothetical protein [Marinospirillum perlucidum]|uniref:hypothetical protein n=1 Tax=Marinospirillum perlucidum TaxID=1982602 RepID=UPI0013903AFA|nr:hypothetical protein [Marinospirillum perlucidum]